MVHIAPHPPRPSQVPFPPVHAPSPIPWWGFVLFGYVMLMVVIGIWYVAEMPNRQTRREQWTEDKVEGKL